MQWFDAIDKIIYTEEAPDSDQKEVKGSLRRKRSFPFGGDQYITTSEVRDAMDAFDVSICLSPVKNSR